MAALGNEEASFNGVRRLKKKPAIDNGSVKTREKRSPIPWKNNPRVADPSTSGIPHITVVELDTFLNNFASNAYANEPNDSSPKKLKKEKEKSERNTITSKMPDKQSMEYTTENQKEEAKQDKPKQRKMSKKNLPNQFQSDPDIPLRVNMEQILPDSGNVTKKTKAKKKVDKGHESTGNLLPLGEAFDAVLNQTELLLPSTPKTRKSKAKKAPIDFVPCMEDESCCELNPDINEKQIQAKAKKTKELPVSQDERLKIDPETISDSGQLGESRKKRSTRKKNSSPHLGAPFANSQEATNPSWSQKDQTSRETASSPIVIPNPPTLQDMESQRSPTNLNGKKKTNHENEASFTEIKPMNKKLFASETVSNIQGNLQPDTDTGDEYEEVPKSFFGESEYENGRNIKGKSIKLVKPKKLSKSKAKTEESLDTRQRKELGLVKNPHESPQSERGTADNSTRYVIIPGSRLKTNKKKTYVSLNVDDVESQLTSYDSNQDNIHGRAIDDRSGKLGISVQCSAAPVCATKAVGTSSITFESKDDLNEKASLKKKKKKGSGLNSTLASGGPSRTASEKAYIDRVVKTAVKLAKMNAPPPKPRKPSLRNDTGSSSYDNTTRTITKRKSRSPSRKLPFNLNFS